MTLRDDVLGLLEAVPDVRLDDVRRYLEQLRSAETAWTAWEERNGGPEADERIRSQVAESDADPRPSIPHEQVAAWLRSWGTDHEFSAPEH